MSPFAVLLAVMGVHLAASVTPGPNVLLIIQTASTSSRRTALAAAAGVATGALILASTAALGLGLLVAGAEWLDRGLRGVCGGYLVYLGFRMWRGARNPMTTTVRGGPSAHSLVVFRRGLLTNITNPKAAIFFGSILTGLLPPATPIWVRLAAVLICVTNSAVWHALLAYAFSSGTVHRIYGRAKTTLDRIAGTLMAALGARFLFEATIG